MRRVGERGESWRPALGRARRVAGFIFFVVGLAGTRDDIRTWNGWIERFVPSLANRVIGGWLLVAIGLALLLQEPIARMLDRIPAKGGGATPPVSELRPQGGPSTSGGSDAAAPSPSGPRAGLGVKGVFARILLLRVPGWALALGAVALVLVLAALFARPDPAEQKSSPVGPGMRVSVIAGSVPDNGDGGDASRARFIGVSDVVPGADGSLYIADRGHDSVRRVDPDGTVWTVAGSGATVGAGGAASAGDQTLAQPGGVAVEGETLYIADTQGHRIRRVSVSGEIETIAGTGRDGFTPDGGDALQSDLSLPLGLDVRPNGDVLFTDFGNNRLRVIDAGDGSIRTLAGGGTEPPMPDPLRGQEVLLNGPDQVIAYEGVALVSVEDGIVYVDDGTLTSLWAGSMDPDAPLASDGARQSDIRIRPRDIAPAPDGDVLFTDELTDQAWRIDDGRIYSIEPASPLTQPLSIAYTSDSERIVVSDNPQYARVVVLGSEGEIDRSYGYDPGGEAAGRSPGLDGPTSVAAGPGGTYYVAEYWSQQISAVDKDGSIETIADLPGNPTGMALDGQTLLVAIPGENSVFSVALSDGVVRREIGSGESGYSGDGGLGSLAELDGPYDVDVRADGSVVVADTGNDVLRQLGQDGYISTIAGTGEGGYDGEGRYALETRLDVPSQVAWGPSGDVYFVDGGNDRLRRVSAAGEVERVVGSGVPGASVLTPDTAKQDLSGAEVALNSTTGLTVGADGTVYFADVGYYHIVASVTPAGRVSILAGGAGGSDIDPAGAWVEFYEPDDLVVDQSGRLIVADWGNGRLVAIDGLQG